MTKRKEKNALAVDYIAFSLYLGLVMVGWLMIYAVGFTPDRTEYYGMGGRAWSQMIWIGISLGAGIIITLIESRFFRTFAYPIYGFGLFLLIIVLFFGKEISGSRSWLDFGFFSFQPSEIGKMATCLCLAGFLGTFNISLKQARSRLIATGIIALPMLLVLAQGDAGSALVYSSLFLVLFREGMPPVPYILGILISVVGIASFVFSPIPIIVILLLLAIILMASNIKTEINVNYLLLALLPLTAVGMYFEQTIPLAIAYSVLVITLAGILFNQNKLPLALLIGGAAIVASGLAFSGNYIFNNVLQPHQQERINVWLQPHKCKPLGSLYNITQSKLAIGSGGIAGKGFLEGTLTKYNYVPEQATDFIFCTVGEEQGFLGSMGVILLYLLLLFRILIIAERQRSQFTRVYAYGVASILFFHFFVNIGMTMGLMPVIGIPLPFISYGGSSLLSFTILMAVLLKLDSNRLLVFR